MYNKLEILDDNYNYYIITIIIIIIVIIILAHKLS